ncbi:MAG TPA: hypothetical protein VFM24_09515 [Nitrospira sp.]|nr:hypothetical protein [Nitrospira sp.]
MLFYALVFLVIGLVGHGLYLAGVAPAASHMSWVLVFVGAVVGMAHVVTDF